MGQRLAIGACISTLTWLLAIGIIGIYMILKSLNIANISDYFKYVVSFFVITIMIILFGQLILKAYTYKKIK